MKSTQRKTSLKWVIFLTPFAVTFFLAFQATGEEWTTEQKEVWNAVLADYEHFKVGNLEEIMATRPILKYGGVISPCLTIKSY